MVRLAPLSFGCGQVVFSETGSPLAVPDVSCASARSAI